MTLMGIGRIREWISAPSLGAIIFLCTDLAWCSSNPIPKLPSTKGFFQNHIRNIDPALSLPFLPPGFVADDSSQLRQFKNLAATLRKDSTRHFEIRNNQLHISYDMLQDLAQNDLPISGKGFGSRIAQSWVKRHGLHFHSPGPVFGMYVPNDYGYLVCPQWALHNTGTTYGDRPGKIGVDIGMEKVWEKFSGNDSLVIAVVDAGIDFHHPDLIGKHWVNLVEAKGLPNVDDDNNGYVDDSLGWDFVDNDNFPDDFHGHGTYCSGVIAAGFDNGIDIAGIIPHCKIMPIRVLDASGHGNQTDIAKGILYAVNNGAKVINFSIGGDVDNAELRNAFLTAKNKGVPIVVAAGNETRDIDAAPAFPASYTYDNMIVVAAHDHAALMSSFSNYGKTSVDLAAPGELVLTLGIPDLKEVWKEGFEGSDLSGWSLTPGAFVLSTVSPVAGKQSLGWTSGVNVTATTTNYLDLIGKEGCSLRIQLKYHPANAYDVLLVEGNLEGSSLWTEIGIVGSDVDTNSVLTYGLQGFDRKKFKLRFRTSARFSSTGRILKLDGLVIYTHDLNPKDEAIYTVAAGTSIAAPHVTAYIGLLRLACDRMGIPWTRAKTLEGVVAEPTLAGKVATGGRLDVYKGLQFYLSTLPDLHVLDSTALIWHVGEKAHYALELNPTTVSTYNFFVNGLGANVQVDGAGKLNWVPSVSDTGTHVITLEADGPTILRKRFSIAVLPEIRIPVTTHGNGQAEPVKIWEVGGQKFSIPRNFNQGRHWIEIRGTSAAGKVQILKKGWMDAAGFGQPYALPEVLTPIVSLQIHLDGRQLQPSI